MRKELWQKSRIGSAMMYVTDFLYHALSVGFWGRLFTSYDRSERLREKSALGNHKRKISKYQHMTRRTVVSATEQSIVFRALQAVKHALLACSLRTFGVFCLTVGAFSLLIYWLSAAVLPHQIVTWVQVVVGITMLVFGVLFLFSDQSLACALKKGLIFNTLFTRVFHVSDESLTEIPKEGKQNYAAAVALGMSVAAVLIWVRPVLLIGVTLGILLALMVLSIPETGVLLFLISVPLSGFFPKRNFLILFLLALAGISYLVKLFKGNRAFHMEIQDLPVLVLALFFLLSGFSVSSTPMWGTVLASTVLILSYFLVVNIISTPSWFHCCRATLIVVATLSSLVGVLQFIMEAVSMGHMSVSTMEAAGVAVRAGCTSHTTFAYFLVIAFAFTLPAAFRYHGVQRSITIISCFLMAGAAVLTWVQSAWIALVAIIVVYALLFEKRSFPILILTVGVLTAVWFILPDVARDAVLSFFMETSGPAAAEHSVAVSRIPAIFYGDGKGFYAAFAGTVRLLFGLGSNGIEAVSLLHLGVAPAVVRESFDFFLTLTCEIGLVGVLVLCFFCFLLLQNCFSLLCKTPHEKRSPACYTGVLLVTGGLILGFFRYAWEDPMALALFFAATALVRAELSYHRERKVVTEDVFTHGDNRAQLEYHTRNAQTNGGNYESR